MFIVFFTHPRFSESMSMPRYAEWLKNGMDLKGHRTVVLSPHPLFWKLFRNNTMRKWMGYIDQYIIFPFFVKRKLKRFPSNTLYVFTDHALGPWVPLVSRYFHVVHCHDFLAQLSAHGEIKENSSSLTGRIYQMYIRRGYRRAANFISISQKTQSDLHRMIKFPPDVSAVVYNGLRRLFSVPCDLEEARKKLAEIIHVEINKGYILHVGGNQWYKNRRGVIEIYDHWRSHFNGNLPLLMIGPPPNKNVERKRFESAFKKDIYFLTAIDDDTLTLAYSASRALLFPSLAEGFGWPIAEAMACGCPVITTAEAPMTEVGGAAAFFIPRRPAVNEKVEDWVLLGASTLQRVVSLSPQERIAVVKNGLENIRRFDSQKALNAIEEIYLKILKSGQ